MVVYFTTAIDLARKLTCALHENRLSGEIKNLTRPKLPIINEIGYLKLEAPEASLGIILSKLSMFFINLFLWLKLFTI